MDKTIILLSGTPSGKATFDRIVKETSWSWNCNSKNFLADITRSLGWDGLRDEKFYKFISEFLSLANRYYEFERKYLEQKIKGFRDDISETKVDRETGREFSNFILILHGVSKELVADLKKDFGVFKIYIARGKKADWDNSNYIPESDEVLFEDEEDFDEQVKNIINKLTERG